MKVKKVTIRVNGNETKYYKVDGSNEKLYDEIDVLRKIFRDHGELYEQLFGIDRETAYLAGWRPYNNAFNDGCTGWKKFREERGKIQKEITEEEFTVEEFVHKLLGF